MALTKTAFDNMSDSHNISAGHVEVNMEIVTTNRYETFLLTLCY
jgi:hypothetical protein